MSGDKGFSLLEIILTIVVFSIGVIGLMVVFYNTLGRSGTPVLRLKAIEVAHSVMDQILSKKFDNDTPNGGGVIPLSEVNIPAKPPSNNTAYFDNVGDFNNLNCTTGSDGCFEGITPGYSVSVKVMCVNINNNKVETTNCPTDYKLITVVVASKNLREKYRLRALKGNF